jgi:hypothetical protein
VGSGENKNFVPVDIDAHVLSLLDSSAVANPSLEGTFEALDRHVDEIDLTEKPARYGAPRLAEPLRPQAYALRPHAHDHLLVIRKARGGKDPDGCRNLAVTDDTLDFVEIAEEARRKEVLRP